MKQTEAFKKLQAKRDVAHKGYTKVLHKSLEGCFYFQLVPGHPENTRIAFYFGRRAKPSKQVVKTDRVADYLNKWDSDCRFRTKKKRTLKVGDIVYCTFGYEQTSVHFYQVTELVGGTSAIFRKLKKHKKYDVNEKTGLTQMHGECWPYPDQFDEQDNTHYLRVVDGDSTNINNMHCHKLGYKVIEDVKPFKEFNSINFSEYG